MSVMIVVKYVNLASAAKKLKIIKNNLSTRELNIKISKSQGKAATELITIAEQLRSIGKTMSLLAGNTETAVNNAIKEFKESDEWAAQSFGKIK